MILKVSKKIVFFYCNKMFVILVIKSQEIKIKSKNIYSRTYNEIPKFAI